MKKINETPMKKKKRMPYGDWMIHIRNIHYANISEMDKGYVKISQTFVHPK